MQYDRRFIPKSKGMGDWILEGGKSPRKKKVMSRGKSISQKTFLNQTKGFNKNRFVDHDGDGVISGMDCFPFNKKKHDTWNPFTGNWAKKREIPDIMRDGLNESLDITRVKGKYSDVARGPAINTDPLVSEIQKRYSTKRQMQRFRPETDRLNKVQTVDEGQLGVESDQFGV